MPLLDIATSFRNNSLYTIGFQWTHNHNVLLFSGGRRSFRWSSGEVPVRRGRLMIKAVATLEPVCSDKDNVEIKPVRDDKVRLGTGDEDAVLVKEDKPVQDDKELLRRNRISKANKGREAWNKGVKHSPETRQKIRERTRLAMRNPEVKKKLMKGIHNQTRETREKIVAAVRQTWDRRRFTRRMIARCHCEWLDLIAEASRKGLFGEEELQWDSYEILSKQLDKEFREGIESRRKKRGSAPGARAPKTLEQRKKISEAIAAKWADPTYRDRVYCGIAKRRGKDPETRDPEWGTKKKEPKKDRPVKKREGMYDTRIRSQRPKLKTSSGPVIKEPQPHARYKDPQARYKLEMIKSIRAQRAASDPKISEAILRANILIGEAQRAAEALEAAAATSPTAEASLIETRKLIAEAISYIKSIETGNSSPGAVSNKEEIFGGVSEIEKIGVNGAVESVKFGEASLKMNVNGMEHVDLSTSSSSSSSSSPSWSDLGLQVKKVEADGEKQEKGSKGRRWVCGRLVEVEEEEDIDDEDKDEDEDKVEDEDDVEEDQ